ncbi:hypothetical protein K469DRAFT_584335 [Zopfia rhizophila CBS 207.26]|uniref:GED domain-containing protein n=1 Tax=Zopfia rhizophila CBS 207.26 TaxID=1314779 RepID=A0A6A6DW95_9PEZI|nr:hypothetical protein K469DRAFT_584335 [Zopfia rhizophila CBS 207.26]
MEPTPFDFRFLYNATPQPSPKPDRRGSGGRLSQAANTAGPSLDLPNRRVSDVSTTSVDEHARPYDVRDEQPPTNTVFFKPQFQTQLTRGIHIAESLAGDLGHCRPIQGSSVYRLLDDARKLSDFQTADTRIVALLGDSGEAGKSSVINSLLHCREVARTSDIGTACTSVITEYRLKAPHHTAPFTIEVEYLPAAEIEEVVKELLWNYRQLYLPDVEQELNADEYKRCCEQSELAWSTLEAAFGDRREFKKELLRDTSAEGKEKVLTLLLQWTRELDWPAGGSDGIWRSTAQETKECCAKTSQFMQNRLWPFTKVIRVYLSAQVLKTGIVLADLPGLRDTNLARVRATERYLLKADHIFIIAQISRAISDQSLKSSLYTALAQHIPHEWNDSAGRFLNVSVVCTKTEEINFDTLKVQFCGPGKAISEEAFQELDRKIKRAKNLGDEKTKKQLKREREFLLIKARNQFVKAGLQSAYAEKVENKTLEVFCVSNKAYEKYAKKGRVEFVEASGIPEVRRFCHTITAQSQLDESKNFLLSKLPSLLSSARLWMEKTLQEADDSATTETIRDELLESINLAENEKTVEFKSDIKEQVLKYMDRRNGYWEKAAKAKSDVWNTWHWTQYNAWCRHNGNYYTEKRGDVNWNSEIIWKMRAELAYQWELVEDEIPEMFKSVEEAVDEAFGEIQATMRSLETVPTLPKSISSRSEDIKYKLQLAQRTTQQAFRTIRRNASEDNYNSYVLNQMLSAYRSASEEYGTGKNGRQIRTVQGRIMNGNLFPPMAVLIQMDLRKLVSQTKKDIERIVKDALKLVKLDVYIMYDEQQDVDEEENEESEGDDEKEDEEGEGKDEEEDDSEGALKLAEVLQDKLPVLEAGLLDVHNTVTRLL